MAAARVGRCLDPHEVRMAGDTRTAPKGLWPNPRKDLGNTARADVPADFAQAPGQVWAYGGAAGVYGFARTAGLPAGAACLVQRGRGLALLRADGSAVWDQLLGVDAVIAAADFTGDGRQQVLVSLGKVGLALLEVADGRRLWHWALPAGSSVVRCQLRVAPAGARLFVIPPSPLATVGYCFDFAGTDGAARLRWEVDFAGRFWANYGPNLILADMDRDGVEELVLASKPAWVGVVDIDTGQLKFECHYEVEDPYGFGRPDGAHIGRPYGLLQAVDLDGDGYPDIVVAATQVEEYLAVLHNDAGQALTPAWTLFIEKDFPEDHRELRAQPTSLCDVNGDGRPELTVGLYNVGLTDRWRTVVLDPLAGYRHPLAEWEGRFFWGCFDLNGDGCSEVITAPTQSRMAPDSGRLEAFGGPDLATAGAVEGARPTTLYSTIARLFAPRRPNPTYYGALVEPLYLPGTGSGGELVIRQAAEAVGEYRWRVVDGASQLTPFVPSVLGRALILSDRDAPLAERQLDFGVGPAADPSPPSARGALVAWAQGRPELIMSLSDGRVVGGVPDLARSGCLSAAWSVRGTMPAVWSGGDGQRWLCVADADAERLRLGRPVPGQHEATAWQVIDLPHPLNRNPMMAGVFPRHEGSVVLFGEECPWVFVPLRLGEHQLGSCLFDAAGQRLWVDCQVGPHPRLIAVADLDGDGQPELLIDNHGMQYHFRLDGRRQLIAQVWGAAVPGRGDGCAHALPVVGPYGPRGELRAVMTPGYSAIEMQAADGQRLWVRPCSHAYQFAGRSAGIGALRGGRQWDLGIVSDLGVLHCVDLDSGQDRWQMELIEATSWPVCCATGDLDHDGRDEFLVGLPDGRLVAVGEGQGQGARLWEVRFDAGVNDAILADLDDDGLAEIIVETEDGFIRVLDNHTG